MLLKFFYFVEINSSLRPLLLPVSKPELSGEPPPTAKACLLSTHWADDLVTGIQAIKHRVETFFIELQASLILFYNRLLCNSTAKYPQAPVVNRRRSGTREAPGRMEPGAATSF